MRRFWTALLVTIPLAHLIVIVPLRWDAQGQDDSAAYALATDKARAGESIYVPYPEPGPHQFTGPLYLYPPFLAATISLTPELEPLDFSRLWLAASILALWVYAACLGALWKGRPTVVGTLVMGAVLTLAPGTLRALWLGQIDVMLWAAFGIALAVPRLRGAAFAASSMVKVYAIWPLLVAAQREGRRVIPGALVAGIVGLAIGVAALGPSGFVESFREWFVHVVPTLSQGQFSGAGDRPLPTSVADWLEPVGGNYSLAFAPVQLALLLGWDYGGGVLSGVVRAYLFLIGVAAPLTAAWLSRRSGPAMQYAVVTCAAVAFLPIVRPSYLPLFLAPVALWLRQRRSRARNVGEPGAAAVGSGAVSAPDPVTEAITP
ncbi:MAG: DUF2029 domain-containing protein [Gemmatimonadetes bacterium]|nr:DUF2029 domain-containing protein [Gemmatimonadota bacterium]